MYNLNSFEQLMCLILKKHFGIVMEGCEVFSIWQFCGLTKIHSLKEFLQSDALCRPRYFPIIFWGAFFITCMGTMRTCKELLMLRKHCDSDISTWRNRQFYVFSGAMLRQIRLVFSTIMLSNWILLLYGLATVSPTVMTPWILVTWVTLAVEFMQLPIKMFYRMGDFEIGNVLAYILPTINLLFIRCIKNVFIESIANYDIEDIQLWPQSY